MEIRVVFLDIDGVLNNPNTRRGSILSLDPVCIANLNRITRETGARIVVSSTWRRFDGINDILGHRGIIAEIIWITPDLDRDRGSEIAEWLRYSTRFFDVSGVVILDDDNDMGRLSDHLVQTDPVIGLSDADADRAVQILSTQFLWTGY